MKKQRVLVTGAAGAVGREVVAELIRRESRYAVTAFDMPSRAARSVLRPSRDHARIILGDLRRPGDVRRALEGADAIVHLAAVIPPAADRDPSVATSVNVGGTKALITAAQQTGRPIKVLYTSSISVYGDRLDDPWICVGDELIPSPHDHYAKTKIQAEELVRASGLPWTILRLSAVLGPDMTVDPLMFHMPLRTALEIVTTRDCGFALVQALETTELDGEVFNLGGGPRCRTTYRECLDRVLSISGLGGRLFPDEAFADCNFHCGYYRDSEELEARLNFQRDGLEDYYDLVERKTSALKRALALAGRPVIRWFLLNTSEPYVARRTGERRALERFFVRSEASM